MGGSNHYSKYYNNFNWCHSQCPLFRGCPLKFAEMPNSINHSLQVQLNDKLFVWPKICSSKCKL